ncbi:DNA translocase FtsK [Sinobacterium caligoides]|uniref:DNA translocase FtsK n=1 Tax=Sinobacterium caligoides TaxID=933926 RepID=A0A3N2DYF9_9GAMM|nr:DNA translocase FtsK [Sinobacterium caligoides]ROS04559.1 DNA translocase FtsK [Sinobacterium caligoides]
MAKEQTLSEDKAVRGLSPRLREGALIASVAIASYLMLALLSYSSSDPGWSSLGSSHDVDNAAGRAGAWLADVLFSAFGYTAALFPLMIAYRGYVLFRARYESVSIPMWLVGTRLLGLVFVVVGLTGMSFIANDHGVSSMPMGSGGIIGMSVGRFTLDAFNIFGAQLLLFSLFLFGLTLFTDMSWFWVMDRCGMAVMAALSYIAAKYRSIRENRAEKKLARDTKDKRKQAVEVELERVKVKPPVQIAPVKKRVEQSARVEREKQNELFPTMEETIEGLPKLELLNEVECKADIGYSQETLEAMSRMLELKLKDFGVVAEVVSVAPGPVITRFEVQPAPGVKASKISGLSRDLARSLAIVSVRVVEVIPGKSVIGIEIPNIDREMVSLKDVLASKVFEDSKSTLTMALGHDISGQPIVADLAKMPHLLVAGTTGSGKSVGVNAMLLSLLYKSTPEEVRLIMIDPKMLELSVYDGIPHLLTPVITDMKDAANGLRWCVAEMERRYALMAALKVRNLAGFNRKIADAKAIDEPLLDPLWQPQDTFSANAQLNIIPELESLPSIVVVIDEFADMMMIVGKKVEELIARIAQKARAAGIHLILATQRPSVDVITGLIKANVPTRIAFQVSSKIDSRTILDQGGAEQLLGQGDMLYLPPGTGVPVRVHGAFVDDDEVVRVAEDLKKRGEPCYVDGLLDDGANTEVAGVSLDGDANAEAQDALFDQAVAFVTETRKASISSVQRHLRVGYNRAANLVDAMQMAGVISGPGHNGSREVLAAPPPKD